MDRFGCLTYSFLNWTKSFLLTPIVPPAELACALRDNFSCHCNVTRTSYWLDWFTYLFMHYSYYGRSNEILQKLQVMRLAATSGKIGLVPGRVWLLRLSGCGADHTILSQNTAAVTAAQIVVEETWAEEKLSKERGNRMDRTKESHRKESLRRSGQGIQEQC